MRFAEEAFFFCANEAKEDEREKDVEERDVKRLREAFLMREVRERRENAWEVMKEREYERNFFWWERVYNVRGYDGVMEEREYDGEWQMR